MKTRLMKKIINPVLACLIFFAAACTKEATQSQATAATQSDAHSDHYIGEHFGGGIIFFLDGNHKHGLITTTQDLEEPLVWSFRNKTTGATSVAIGAGRKNTSIIRTVLGDPIDESFDYAAIECGEFEVDGYHDWYLPSKNELNELYKHKDQVGGFLSFSYWTSSEIDSATAWLQNINTGQQIKSIKLASYALRPVRIF